jgi:Cupin-like domain
VYLAQHPLFDYVRALEGDFAVPKYAAAGGGAEGDVLVNVWMGGAGTGTRLHCDTADNLLVQVVGTKAVTLFDACETPNLHVRAGDNFSPVDVDDPDYEAHPRLRDARATSCVLQPGDALYVPRGPPSSGCLPPVAAAAGLTRALSALIPPPVRRRSAAARYIPAGCWHWLRARSPSISVNFWF